MKNVLYLFIIFLLTFISCSENKEIIEDAPKLLIKIEQVQTEDNSSSILNYNYNSENKLISITNDTDFIVNLFYDSNGVFIKSHQVNQDTYENYEYNNNNKVSKYTRVEDNVIVNSIEYTYDNDNLTTEKVSNSFNSPSTIVYSYEYNDNNVKKTSSELPNDYEVYKYDGKKMPFFGVNSFKKTLHFIHLGNEIETKVYREGILHHTIVNTITYDEDNYPVKIVTEGTNGYPFGKTKNYTYNK